MRKNRKQEKEPKKRRFFARDEEYDEDDEIGEEDEDEDEDEEDVDDEDDGDEEDDDDDDSDDEEDDDDGDGDDGGRQDREEVRRARRRARRIRNQILAYAVVALLAAGVLGGIFLGGRSLVRKFQADRPKKEQQEQASEVKQEKEPVVEIESAPEEEPQGEEPPALSPLDEIVVARITEMPLEDKVAALFMVTPEQLTGVKNVTRAGDTTKKALMQYKVGGIVYTASNISWADQLKEMLRSTALIDQTLFLAVNEEGGKNSVLGGKIAVTKVADMASVKGVDGAYTAGSNTGTYLAEYGFNLNLAPVADVKVSADSILGNRSFGSDPAQVGEMAAAYVKGLTEKGVSACVKMFPGLGGVKESTAKGMADTERSLGDMESVEFPAYRAAIEAGSEFVMVGAMSAPQLTGDNTPCCLSQAVIGLLRNNLGYNGIVMTGALNEAAVKDYHTSAEAAEKALRAGADMLYMPENFKEAYEGLLQAAEGDEELLRRIDEALIRIYRVKYKDKVAEAPEGGTEEIPEKTPT